MRHYNATAVLDREQLSDACMDDQELMRELVTSLIDDTTQQLIVLQAAVERDDGGECQRVAHYVKGACANLGAASMAGVLKAWSSRRPKGTLQPAAFRWRRYLLNCGNCAPKPRPFSRQNPAIFRLCSGMLRWT
jgi:HPt (histidine-containing phosphotransfer) domain-containing protein